MIQSVLVANRGEIACRVIRACREMGIRTIAVFAEPDAGAKHVREADEAYALDGTTAAETYLQIEKLLNVARESGADALHPGYGFLAENAGLASACADAGVVFIGPPPTAISAMGSKIAAKALMEKAGVPTMPGTEGETLADADLAAEAERIGFPVLVKASAGGGGKGMVVVEDGQDLPEVVASTRRLAQSAFGDDAIMLEKYLAAPRHVEVQVLADTHGTCLAIGERDCSVQRRHQKVIEESPCAVLREDVRQAMHAAAVNAAMAVGYVGAGTVEFLLDADQQFYFLEMNTRLQVEHPVTESVTGVDLVKWQLRIANGEELTLDPAAIHPRGHALECRIYAEDPANGFLPSTGTLACLRWPTGTDVRVDSGVDAGDAVTPYFDPMLAKLIVRGETREDALRKMRTALEQTVLLGVRTNVEFLKQLVAHGDVVENRISTQWLEQTSNVWAETHAADEDVLIAVAVAELLRSGIPAAQEGGTPLDSDPFNTPNRWRASV